MEIAHAHQSDDSHLSVERLKGRRPHAHRITLDLDATCDPTHVYQQGTFFNAIYDTWCYLHLLGFLSVPGEKEQHLFAARLRRGTTPATHCMIPTRNSALSRA